VFSKAVFLFQTFIIIIIIIITIVVVVVIIIIIIRDAQIPSAGSPERLNSVR